MILNDFWFAPEILTDRFLGYQGSDDATVVQCMTVVNRVTAD